VTTCNDLRDALIVLARPAADSDDLNDALRREAEAHVVACPRCAAELADLRSTLAQVRSELVIEPLAHDAVRLMAAVDRALEEHAAPRLDDDAPQRDAANGTPVLRPTFGERVRGTWEYAHWRYASSRPFRRFVLTSVAAHAAAVLFVGFLLIEERARSRNPELTWDEVAQNTPWDSPLAPDDARPERPDEFGGFVVGDDDLGPARFEAVDPVGVRPEPLPSRSNSAASGGTADMRFPTVSAMLRYRAVVDDEERAVEMRQYAGHAAQRVHEGIDRALAWLASRRRAGQLGTRLELGIEREATWLSHARIVLQCDQFAISPGCAGPRAPRSLRGTRGVQLRP
jgi:hypothetical protein